MPLDAICLKGVVGELQQSVGLRIEKIQQPARDQVILTLTADEQWIEDAQRVFPVIIDPTCIV